MLKGDKWYQGKYLQGSLSDNSAYALVNLIENCDVVESLKHIIKDVPKHIVQDIITDFEDYQREHGTAKGFQKDYSEHFRVGTLRDTQTVGVAFMYYAGSSLMGDEVGLGKTVQIAGLCNLLKAEYTGKGKEFRYCFLTEKTSIDQIRKKMIQFTGEYVNMLESGEHDVVTKYIENVDKGNRQSVVGGHSLLNSSEFLIHSAKNPFDLIIVDESSVLKNVSSDIYQNCKALFKYHEKKILLNATPLEQEAMEFYNQLDLLDPLFLMTKEAFKSRYCKMKPGMLGFVVDGYKNTEEFRTAIALRYIARTRADLGAQYEGNKYRTILVPQSEAQKQLMKKTTLYQMVNDYPPAVDRRVPFSIETTPKAAALLQVLGSLDVANGKALVYCRYKDCQKALLQLLNDNGYRAVIVNGETKIKERNDSISKFLSGAYDVLITNVLRGLDLNNCDNCIMYTIDPNPQKMVQFEGRITRDLDVMYKTLILLVAMGKEKKFVEETLKMRVDAASSFVKSGKSMIIAALKTNENVEVFKREEE